MKIIPLAEKDKHKYIAIEDLGDGTCVLYEPGEENLVGLDVMPNANKPSIARRMLARVASMITKRG